MPAHSWCSHWVPVLRAENRHSGDPRAAAEMNMEGQGTGINLVPGKRAPEKAFLSWQPGAGASR